MPIFLGDNTAVLLETMATALAASRDPWARHWLVVPGHGRSEWLQRRWARLTGVAAHSQLVSLRSLIEQTAAPQGEPFLRVRLELAVARALSSLAHPLVFQEHSDLRILDARVLGWSQQIADAIDSTLLCRTPGNRWADSWLAEVVDHPAVQQALSNHLGQLDQETYRTHAADWIDRWQARGGVPKLWIMLDAGLPGVLLQRFTDLFELLDHQAYVALLNPSPDYWGDLRTLRNSQDHGGAGPVLSCLGQQAQDLHNQMIECFLSHGTGGEVLPPAATKASLLGLLQQACRNVATPVERPVVIEGDWSFTVHACRSALRELEVCRDRILQATLDDPSLGLDDVLVLLTDAPNYAPLVAAAFAPLPVRVIDAGGHAQSQVASGLIRLLKTISGRISLADVQSLIEEPLIAARFGFSGSEQSLVDWLAQAGFRWGIDAAQRAQYHERDDARWSLAFALRRLGLGAVVEDAQRDALVAGAAPLERAAGLGTAHLAQLVQFATALYQARKAWTGADPALALGAPRPMEQWCALLGELCERFVGVGQGALTEERTQLVNGIIPRLGEAAPKDLLVQGDALRRLIESLLIGSSASHGAHAGGITVADLHQYAGTPARMILVAGLGAESFPRRQDRPAWHPLAAQRMPGDPDVRAADRHALLLALLACAERLVLTYQGGSDADNKIRPPSTPVADLLAAVDIVAVQPNGTSAAQNIHITHGLHGFSPGTCAATNRDVARPFLPSDYLGAAALQGGERQRYPGLWSRPLASPAQAVTLGNWDLRILLQEPCQVYVRRLGLRVPEQADEPVANDMLELDALARWSLRDRMLRCKITAGNLQALQLRAQAAGELPAGLYGEQVWHRLQQELPAVAERGLTPITERIQVSLAQRSIDAQLSEGWYHTAAGAVAYCTASSKTKRKWLEVLIGLTLLGLREKTQTAEAWFKESKRPLTLAVPHGADATRLLTQLCDLHQLAQCLPLPFWSGTYEQMR